MTLVRTGASEKEVKACCGSRSKRSITETDAAAEQFAGRKSLTPKAGLA